jgi:dTDP-glucose 4,6-dehydratase
MAKQWLITGGAGFIGSNFITHLLATTTQDQILCLDKLTYAGHLETMAPFLHDPRFAFVLGDITDVDLVETLLSTRSFDVVVNFAAESHVDRSLQNADPFYKTNVEGVKVLFSACERHGVHFHQVSTDEVYGALPLGTTHQFTEISPLNPTSPYAKSKALADAFVIAQGQKTGQLYTISRCSNNYGPYQYPEKLIPFMITKALRNEPLPIYGDGRYVRDWLHVSDHCAAIDLIVRRGTSGRLYNISANHELDNVSLVKHLLGLINKPETLITFVADRFNHDRRYALDASRIKRELGWTPKMDFETGLKHTIEWYLTHLDWVLAVSITKK